MKYVEHMRDFCGTMKSMRELTSNIASAELYDKVENAYTYTKKICYLHKEEWIGRKASDDDVIGFFKQMVSNVMTDIFETGMYPMTKAFINTVLLVKRRADDISETELEQFVHDYYGDLAGELAMDEDTLMSEINSFTPDTTV